MEIKFTIKSIGFFGGMKMKKLISTICLVMVITVFASANGGQDSKGSDGKFPETTLMFSMFEPQGSVLGQGCEVMKKYIEDKTDGSVTVEIYYNSSLIPQDEEVDQLMKGNIDFASFGVDWLIDMQPDVVTFFVPFLFKDWDHAEAFWSSDKATKYLDDLAAKSNIRFFPDYAYRGSRTINLSMDKKVASRADLQGVKMRFPNIEIWQLIGQSCGANAVPLALSEVYLALQTGTVDGQDNAPSTIISSSFFEVTKSVTLTGHNFSTIPFATNETKWQTYSPELQQIIRDGVKAGTNYVTETVLKQDAQDVAFLKENGLSVYELSSEEKASYGDDVMNFFLKDEIAKDVNMDLLNYIKTLE